MKASFAAAGFDSQDTCFLTAGHVLGANRNQGLLGSPFRHWFLEPSRSCDVTGSVLSGFVPLQRVGEFSGKFGLGCFPMFSWHSWENKDNRGRGKETETSSQIDGFEIF